MGLTQPALSFQTGSQPNHTRRTLPVQEEKRAVKRYRISALAQFRWQTSTGEWVSGSGVTVDVSVSGVYILCTCVPDIGALIEMKLAVTMGRSSNKSYLFGKGSVTRVNNDLGFAAAVVLQLLRVDQARVGADW
jgi:hypothetical protein